ncbi:peptide/nickel transport system ATP-binding protein/peptide/nickel transport system ATP-binding protein [Frondihabitans sp. PhB188]|uniref:ABC transporter ATP-binding protein n=1 Tax=Frondihabitans sp. PhB188 TaxID=2485200 RepID=UPI000F4AE2EC|nr:ABC transporter ATP-binding protein [Frondihabitans sp. PhB188]ROQ39703.1 peptide/nickel transport system ATP-binding protein/peptide/nickel transport system ATP-binding protein [Frondihabitans sp. PhB188]
MSAESLLDVRNLSIQYPGTPTRAVDEVTFQIGRGEVVALVGESGSGKSTLARGVAGLLTDERIDVTSTALTFDGAPIERNAGAVLPERIPGITMMFQDASTSLDVVWSVEDQLVAILRNVERMSKKAARVRAIDWLDRVGLADTQRVMKAKPYELSGGMRQRVMLALALASAPRLLIADEPTSALDASLSRLSMELMTSLTTELGTALLIVSHDIAMCTEFSDRTLVMYHGALVDQGASATLTETVTHPYARGLLACVPTFEHLDDDELPTLDLFLTASTSAAKQGAAA